MSVHSMRITRQLLKLFYAGLPVQRYVIVLSVVLFALGVAALPYAPREARLALTLGTSLLLFVVLAPAGWTFRQLSLPSAHRFVPRFRSTMLIALLLMLLTPPLLVASLVLSTGAPAAAFAVATYGSALISGLVWLLFFLPASLWAGLTLVAAIAIVASLPETQQAIVERALAPQPVAAMLIAAWGAFAVWYLRTARVGPFVQPFPLRALFEWELRRYAVLNGRVARAVATTVQLTQRTRPGPRDWIAITAIVVVIGALAASALSDRPSSFVFFVVVAMVAAYPAARQVVSRARSLWLTAALSRTGLYRAAERELLLTVLPMTVMVLIALLACIHVLAGSAAPALAALLLCALTTTWFALYLGLMRTAKFGPVDAAASAALTLTLVGVGLLASSGAGVLIVSALQAVGALICRSIGLHRWRTVDWAALRPSRSSLADLVSELIPGVRG